MKSTKYKIEIFYIIYKYYKMKKRINSKIRQFQLKLKNDLKDKIITDISQIKMDQLNTNDKNKLLDKFAQNLITYIYEYNNLTFTEQDFQNVKN